MKDKQTTEQNNEKTFLFFLSVSCVWGPMNDDDVGNGKFSQEREFFLFENISS